MTPLLSVIMPVHNGAPFLYDSLAALTSSDLPRSQWEVIVADDGSSDATQAIAAATADRVISVPGGPRGPAAARNLGARAARGEILVFVDADVCVAKDTLRRFAELFASRPELGAAFGAYDSSPRESGIVSQYRNLLHHYVHSTSPGPATTFWAGCGAIRTALFERVGGFDAVRYPRPSIEDIELGYRMSAAGASILLCPEIQGTHLKRWTLRGGFVTDFRDRGVPWMHLLVERKEIAGSGPLNLQVTEKLFTILVPVGCMLALASAVLGSRFVFVCAMLALLVVVAGNAPLLAWFARVRGAPFALAILPLRLAYYALNAVSAAWALATFSPRRSRQNTTIDSTFQSPDTRTVK